MCDILIPEHGDFDAWRPEHSVCLAVDWDGTCKDTMTVKWAKGFNLAMTEVWPDLAPFQKQVDDVCWRVNMVEEATAGHNRMVNLRVMMEQLEEEGLPVPDLAQFYQAVGVVLAAGEPQSVETYRRLQHVYGFDDSVFRWSDRSDEIIAANIPEAEVFHPCDEVLAGMAERADVLLVSASKTDAVVGDLRMHEMTGLFRALLAQEFLPKGETLKGLMKKYQRVVFVADTDHDARLARRAGAVFFKIEAGNEKNCWRQAGRRLPSLLTES